MARLLQTLVLASALLLIVGCANTYDRNPVPKEHVEKTQVLDIPNARFWADERSYYMDQALNQPGPTLRQQLPSISNKEHNYLAISGGGDKGAFGAGLLCGWTAAGTRPEFEIVTGISTGGLTAPFAFLGPKYDYVLKEVYTTTTTKDLAEQHSLTVIFTGDSVVDTTGLKNLIEKHVNEEFVNEIAAEYRKGRRLWIGTTNLDIMRPVMWNIGAIANTNDPRRIDLIRQILRASAAIPVAFPPEYIEVEIGDEIYDEMHVDGGATTQVILYPESLAWADVLAKLQVPGSPNAYVILNAFVDPVYEPVDPAIMDIAGKTVASLIRTQGLGDLDRIYAASVRDGLEFKLAFPPGDLPRQGEEAFDPEYMQILFDRGFDMALSGYPWDKTPPHFDTD
ncbi:MAG: patatin-like phospholipase family protein [Verrucomicrobiota bacterium]